MFNMVNFTLSSLVAADGMSVEINTKPDMWDRVKGLPISYDVYNECKTVARFVGVTDEFKRVIDTFKVAAGIIPAGFCPVLVYDDGRVLVDLKRNIAYGENGQLRPTNVLFSADSANPYEVEPFKHFIANLTCNPHIIHQQFLNDPQVNIGSRFKDRYEVMAELCRIVGPGVDISVEVDNPFADEHAILEEIERFKEILTPYRLVVKVPHTGPVNRENAASLLDGSFEKGYRQGSIADHMYGHNMAKKLTDKGYRVNFTLMFEPHQAALALQAKPYFINTFLKQRWLSSNEMDKFLKTFRETGDIRIFQRLKDYMRSQDMISPAEYNGSDRDVLNKADGILRYRKFHSSEGSDGLDDVRHSLRIFRNLNLPDTRLIICSFVDECIYNHVDKLLAEPEFQDMNKRVVLTAPPSYFSQFACASGVLTYQRMFLGAVAT